MRETVSRSAATAIMQKPHAPSGSAIRCPSLASARLPSAIPLMKLARMIANESVLEPSTMPRYRVQVTSRANESAPAAQSANHKNRTEAGARSGACSPGEATGSEPLGTSAASAATTRLPQASVINEAANPSCGSRMNAIPNAPKTAPAALTPYRKGVVALACSALTVT